LQLLCETNLLSQLVHDIIIKYYINTCANDRLIMDNNFILQITNGFYNLFFISIGTSYVTSRSDTLKLYTLKLNKTILMGLLSIISYCS
jgi:hypothetical protein